MKKTPRVLAEKNGPTVIEYALIVGIITFTALAVMVALGIKFMGLVH